MYVSLSRSTDEIPLLYAETPLLRPVVDFFHNKESSTTNP